MTVKVKRGKVRLFGVSLERDVGGIVVDSLGVGALNVRLLSGMDQPLAIEGLKRRDYDLIIDATGTNMWAPKSHAVWLDEVLKTWRTALPNASYMLWSPPDHIHKGGGLTSEPRMKACTQEKHDIALAEKIGYWDQYNALGGFGSMPKWYKDGWCEPDGVHLGPKMNQYVGERFVHALLDSLAKRVKDDPKLGCAASP
jgi:hypothetical protein